MNRLEATGLAKSFGGVVALDGVGIAVGPGEVVGLLGPNGAGKTTLFDCLAGVRRPDRGKVWLDGVDVTGLAPYQRARLGLARTFQQVELFADLDVRQHLAVAARARTRGGRMLSLPRWAAASILSMLASDNRGRSAGAVEGAGAPEDQPAGAERAQVEEILHELGLDAVARLPADSLGLGLARLVELGRALAGEPTVVLADEPSSGLDEHERRTLAQALPALTERGAAVVVIEHDIDLVRQVAHRVYVLEAGRVVASGEARAVLDDPRLARAYGQG